MRKGMEKFIVIVWFDVLDKEGGFQSFEPRIKITQGKRWHAANVIIKAFEKQMSPTQCYAIYNISFTPVISTQGVPPSQYVLDLLDKYMTSQSL